MIVPLLRRRAAFSGTSRFHLYDAFDDGGHVVEDVYAFTNGAGPDRSLVLAHHRYAETTVRIDRSIAAAPPGGGSDRTSVRLADALELHGAGAPADDAQIRLHDPRTGWELRRTAAELRREGLRITLGPYEARVLSVEIVIDAPAIGVPEAATVAPAPTPKPKPVAATTKRTRKAPAAKPAAPPRRLPANRPARKPRTG
jgi:hypothetical protein